MAKLIHTMTIRVRWWVYPYLECVRVFSYLFGTDPDVDHVAAFVYKYGFVLVPNMEDE